MINHESKRQFLLALLAYAEGRGIAKQQVCQDTGIGHKQLQTGSSQPFKDQLFENVWKNLVHLSNDPLFGLHFGESMQLAALGVVGQIVQSSNTVAEALTHAGASIHLITDLVTLQMQHDDKTCTIHLIPVTSPTTPFTVTFRQMVDYLMVFIVHELDGLLLERLRPRHVSFAYPIANKHEYNRIFRCEVSAMAETFSITFDISVLNYSLISANYELQQFLLQQVGVLRSTAVENGKYYSKIFNYLLANSYMSDMSLEAVASNFHVSPRSLQRKLKDEGISYAEIVEEVRYKLATKYLSSGRHAVKDIAYTLGYNEPTAFVRAFKRWAGETPHAYMQTNRTKEARE